MSTSTIPAFLESQPLREFCGSRGNVSTVTNHKGVNLAVYSWPVDRPKAIVQLVHGSDR